MGSWVGVKLLCHFLTSPAKTADLILKQIKQDVGCFLKSVIRNKTKPNV